MGPDEVQRKLTTIFSTDVQGYSRLMGDDEAATVRTLMAYREIISSHIERNGGRVIDSPGDNLLAEFGSVVLAAECAVEIQRELKEKNEALQENRRMRFRIGINLGDVIVEGDRLYGDGVNIAARLEALSEGGGICISGGVFDQVRGKLPLSFEDLGEQKLKNISNPIRAYAVAEEIIEAPAPAATEPPSLPDKPSVAVLPFNNLSGDPEQEYFADGMTEDIITGLSRFRSLFVIARNSTFAYKGKSPDVREVARDLGVRYVLEGSVRRGGERIRITGQLIDAETGNHLWAERYDRELEDIFAVQDEVTEAIVAAIAPEIGDVERERAQRKPPDNLDAWDLYQHGLAANHSSTEEGLRSAIEQFDRVNEIDPTFAPAFAMASHARWRYVGNFGPDDRSDYLNQAREKAYRAIALDPRDPIGFSSAGRVHSFLGQHDVAISKIEEAIALNPNDALSRHLLGAALCSAGRSEEAIPHIDHAMRLSPRDIHLTTMLTLRAFALFDLERYDETFEWARRARLSPNPRTMTFALFAAVLIKLGRQEEARAALGDLLVRAPGMSCAKYREHAFGAPEVMERLADALREAGLPDTAPSAPSKIQQEIRFCPASDGVRIAYATAGQGPPLVKAANWLNHLEYDWESPIWRHMLYELSRDHLLIRYDERGNGLSDWDVDDISFEAFVRDLETVVDAAGLERFPLLGISQGCSVSIAYAVRHPERVTHLVLYGGYARGQFRRGSAEAIEQAEAMMTLMRQGWGQENPAFRQLFTSRFIPGGTQEQMQWFNDLQRMTASPQNAVRLRRAINEIEVSSLLSEVTTPTLVLHCRNEVAVPFDEGRLMASMIPGARFVALEGQNHLILEDEPAWPRFLEEVRNFLGS